MENHFKRHKAAEEQPEMTVKTAECGNGCETTAFRGTILFRCDGNPVIGAGHMMRCLSIADAASLCWHILFVTSSNHFEQIITSRGYRCMILHTPYNRKEAELDQFLPIIYEAEPACVIVDSYEVTDRYLRAVGKACGNCGVPGVLAYMDDLLSFAYPVDILINYNIYGPDKAGEYKALYQSAGVLLPQLLLGTAYAPLRQEFANLPQRVITEEVSSILISTGGADPDHIARKLCQYITDQLSACDNASAAGSDPACAQADRAGMGQRLRHLTFHFVLGAMNSDRDQLEALAAPFPGIRLHYNVKQMQRLMSGTDLAISAAGSTLYELCAAGTPAVTYVLADNQIAGAQGFERHGVLMSAGDIRQEAGFPQKLLSAALDLAADYERRSEISARQKKLVDGGGARRVIEALTAKGRENQWRNRIKH